METITGAEAIDKMRELKHSETQSFVLHHLTWNAKTEKTSGLRVVARCRLRPAMPEEGIKPHPELFLPYMDLDLAIDDQPRICYKRLIRAVAFPPENVLLKVKWFENEN